MAAAPNPPLVCPKGPLLPVVAGAPTPKPLPAVEEKLNPEADPNPEAGADLSVVLEAKEKLEAEGAEEDAALNPEGGCVGAAKMLPKPVEDDCVAAEPNPLFEAEKLKPLAWAGAGAPKPLLPKLEMEAPNPVAVVEPNPPEDP